MDKRKYQTKTLIAEYEYQSKIEGSRFSETAYRLKDGSVIIEFDGGGLSIYGLTIAFAKYIRRKGVYSINHEDFEMWKSIRRKRDVDDSDSSFIDWEMEIEELMNEDHENVLKCVGVDELPY